MNEQKGEFTMNSFEREDLGGFVCGVLALIGLAVLFYFLWVRSVTPPVELSWFDMRVDTYGPNTLTFDYFYFEDHDPNSYMGTINLIVIDGEWVVDEFVDLVPCCGLSESDVLESMTIFSDRIIAVLNRGKSLDEVFKEMPQDFGEHTTYKEDLEGLKRN